MTNVYKNITPYFCSETLTDVVLPMDRIATDETAEWLIIGFPGVDGIEFRTRAKGTDSDIFAFYPIEHAYVKIANSVDDLIDKWKAGQVTL